MTCTGCTPWPKRVLCITPCAEVNEQLCQTDMLIRRSMSDDTIDYVDLRRRLVAERERAIRQRGNRRMLAVAVVIIAVAFAVGMMRGHLVLPESVAPAAIEQSAKKVLHDL